MSLPSVPEYPKIGLIVKKNYPLATFWLNKDENMLSNKFSQPIGQYISHSYRKQNYCLKPYILRPNQHLLVQIQQQHTVQNMFKVNNRSNTRCSGVFTVNYEYIWHVSNVFLFVCLFLFCWGWPCNCQMEYLFL